MPAWTFVASAAGGGRWPASCPSSSTSIRDLGARPARDDADVIARAPGEVGAVMPVVPFGRPIDFDGWDRFRSRTGLPVVIDAAAGFDSVTPTETPAVVSLHATKVFGVGEGGFVLSDDPT